MQVSLSKEEGDYDGIHVNFGRWVISLICWSRTSREVCEVIDNKQPIPPLNPADGAWIEQAKSLTDRAQTRSAKFPAAHIGHGHAHVPFIPFSQPSPPARSVDQSNCESEEGLNHAAKTAIGARIGNRRSRGNLKERHIWTCPTDS